MSRLKTVILDTDDKDTDDKDTDDIDMVALSATKTLDLTDLEKTVDLSEDDKTIDISTYQTSAPAKESDAVNLKRALTAAKLLGNVNEYTFVEELGSGATGDVFRAIRGVNESFAIKRIKSRYIGTVEQEINILKKLQPYCKPYLLCYHTHFIFDDHMYIVTEYLKDFTTLSDLIEKKNPAKNNPELVVKIIVNMIRGLRHLQKLFENSPVVHRDIKPHNLMVNTVTGDVKFIDFGFTCYGKECENIRKMRGTPFYMAPELFRSRVLTMEYLVKTDIWAMAHTIINLCLGDNQLLVSLWLMTDGKKYEKSSGWTQMKAFADYPFTNPKSQMYPYIDKINRTFVASANNILVKHGEKPINLFHMLNPTVRLRSY